MKAILCAIVLMASFSIASGNGYFFHHFSPRHHRYFRWTVCKCVSLDEASFLHEQASALFIHKGQWTFVVKNQVRLTYFKLKTNWNTTTKPREDMMEQYGKYGDHGTFGHLDARVCEPSHFCCHCWEWKWTQKMEKTCHFQIKREGDTEPKGPGGKILVLFFFALMLVFFSCLSWWREVLFIFASWEEKSVCQCFFVFLWTAPIRLRTKTDNTYNAFSHQSLDTFLSLSLSGGDTKQGLLNTVYWINESLGRGCTWLKHTFLRAQKKVFSTRKKNVDTLPQKKVFTNTCTTCLFLETCSFFPNY